MKVAKYLHLSCSDALAGAMAARPETYGGLAGIGDGAWMSDGQIERMY